MERTDVSRNQLVNSLLHIGHGDLSIYNDVGLKAAKSESELFAHLIAWNFIKGEVRDSKMAFPVLALRGDKDDELYENAVAHLCLLDPRDFLKGLLFSRGLSNGHIKIKQKVPQTFMGKKIVSFPDNKERYIMKMVEKSIPPAPITSGSGKILKKGIELYLRVRESNRKWWDRTALQHRKSLKGLYALNHIKPASFAQNILFDRHHPKGIFAAVKQLKDMSQGEAAGTILNYEIPFIIAVGALGGIKDKPDIVLALIEQMSGNELIGNTQMLKRFGVFENPVLKSAYEKAMERARKDKRVSSLKASKASEVITDKKAKVKLKQIQEDGLKKIGGIEGDWLVLGDKSGSMEYSVELAKEVSGLIAQQVKGSVHLIYFDTAPTYYDVSGKSLDEIKGMTRRIGAGGGTSIGCGLDMLYSKGIIINGIVICSDGGENTDPFFANTYKKYVEKFGIEPTVYLFHVPGERNVFTSICQRVGIIVETFEIGSDVDYYSLPNLIKSLRTSKYSLVEEIMESTLLTFKEVFEK